MPKCQVCGREMWPAHFDQQRGDYEYVCQYLHPQWPTLEQAALRRSEHVRGLTWTGFDLLETRGVR